MGQRCEWRSQQVSIQGNRWPPLACFLESSSKFRSDSVTLLVGLDFFISRKIIGGDRRDSDRFGSVLGSQFVDQGINSGGLALPARFTNVIFPIFSASGRTASVNGHRISKEITTVSPTSDSLN